MRVRVALIVLAALACSGSVLAAEAGPSRSLLVWCAGETFPYAGLSNPVGAEDADTEPAAALRAFLETRRGLNPPQNGWRLVAEFPDKVLFGNGRPPKLFGVRVIRADDGAWRFDGYASCRKLLRVRGGLPASPWKLRPGTKLSKRTRVLRLLVEEDNCASGMSAKGRIQSPLVRYRRRSVRLAFFIRPLTGLATCPSNPPTPYRLRLRSPLGNRRLLDAGTVPASPPTGPLTAPTVSG